MNYDETVDWLFNQLPVYQIDGVFKYKVNLDPIVKLCKHLYNPHLNFHSIHVAGTNGKGSSSYMLSSILQEAGYKVGLYTCLLYTSPSPRDRQKSRMPSSA